MAEVVAEVLHKSIGTLRYYTHTLNLLVDQGIVEYYRHLLPRNINKQKYDAHISVVRKETPNADFWGKYEGELIEFQYSPIVRWGTIYYWLDAYCDRLMDIRTELGLSPTTDINRPPDQKRCFHITIGNIKDMHAGA